MNTRESFPLFVELVTRWADNDVYGHVNNATYYAYFDTVVNRYLTDHGVLHLHDSQSFGVIVETGCKFYASVAFPDVLEVGLRVAKLGNTSVQYELGVFRKGSDVCAAEARFVHVYVDRATRRPVPVPVETRAVLQPLVSPCRAPLRDGCRSLAQRAALADLLRSRFRGAAAWTAGHCAPRKGNPMIRRFAAMLFATNLCATAALAAGAQEPPKCGDEDSIHDVKRQYKALEELKQGPTIKTMTEVKEMHFGPAPKSANQYSNKLHYATTSRWCQGTATLSNGKSDTVYWRMDYLVDGKEFTINLNHCATGHDLLDAHCKDMRAWK
jgi:acyl-CoA thioester hydrolase